MKYVKAFSLYELLITLAILGILSVLIVPNLRHYLLQSRAQSELTRLMQMMTMAQDLAYSSGSKISLCASAKGEVCANDWSAGQMLFFDSNGNGLREPNEKVIYQQAGSPYFHLELRHFPATQTLSFSSDGRHSHGHWRLCLRNGEQVYHRALVFNQAGRLRQVTQNSARSDRKYLNCMEK